MLPRLSARKVITKAGGAAGDSAAGVLDNKKNIGFIVKKCKKINFANETNALLKKRIGKPIPAYGFGPWICNTRLEML